jgi:hypothetical protein
MQGWLRRLLGRPATDAEAARRPRRDSAVYALELHEGLVVPGTLRCLSPAGDFTQPMISACGTRVAYWGVGRDDDAPRIWISRVEGDPAPVRAASLGGMQGHPYWHPDGVRLVHFASAATAWDASRQFSTERAPSQLHWLDTRTGAASPLTEGPYTDERPAVTPDGRAVVFVSNRSGRLNLWRVDADGSGLTQLTDGPGPDYRPCVSPDGRLLAYFAPAVDGSHQVRILVLATGQPLQCRWSVRFAWSHGPYWCWTASTLLVHALERGASLPALWRLDVMTGEARRLDIPGLTSASHGSLDRAQRHLACDSRTRTETDSG